MIGSSSALTMQWTFSPAAHSHCTTWHTRCERSAYVQQSQGKNVPPIGDFAAALMEAREELLPLLKDSCGQEVQICAHKTTVASVNQRRTRPSILLPDL